MNLKMIGIVVGLALGCPAIAKTSADNSVIETPSELEALFLEQQYQFLPVSPPSEEVYVHPHKTMIPVDWSRFPPAFTKGMYAQMDDNGYPVYRVLIYEDPLTRETVFLNSHDTEVYRLAPGNDYDPYAWLIDQFGLDAWQEMDDFHRWIFDPAHIAAEFTLLPETFYTDYLLAQGQLTSDMMLMETFSSPPPPDGGGTNGVPEGGSSSNLNATLVFAIDEDFGASYAEIFQCTNLISAVSWEVAAEHVAVTAGTDFAWTDLTSSNIPVRFYILNDPSLDQDGDFLNDGRELFVTRSLEDDADSDNGQIPDGYEVAYDMDPNDSADDTATAISNYLAVAGDPDQDASPDWRENLRGTNPHDCFD